MKQTIVDQIEITRNGSIQIRMKKQIVDGSSVFDIGYHRTALIPGGDPDAQLSVVNAHLLSMEMGEVSTAEWQRVRDVCAFAWTPEVIAAYQASLAKSE